MEVTAVDAHLQIRQVAVELLTGALVWESCTFEALRATAEER
jgi:hypothetical protein